VLLCGSTRHNILYFKFWFCCRILEPLKGWIFNKRIIMVRFWTKGLYLEDFWTKGLCWAFGGKDYSVRIFVKHSVSSFSDDWVQCGEHIVRLLFSRNGHTMRIFEDRCLWWEFFTIRLYCGTFWRKIMLARKLFRLDSYIGGLFDNIVTFNVRTADATTFMSIELLTGEYVSPSIFGPYRYIVLFFVPV